MKILKGTIITPFEKFFGHIIVEKATIMDVVKGEVSESGNNIMDFSESYICPGFVNIHAHGAVGVDFSNHNLDSFSKISRFMTSTGVTRFLGTTMTLSKEELKQTLLSACDFQRTRSLYATGFNGLHFEGPYINKKFKGAQNPEYILEADDGLLIRLAKGNPQIIKTVSLAPEINGAEGLIKELLSLGIYISAGHTGADYELARKAFDWGVNRVTHLFNAMPPLLHRAPGIITAALQDERVFVEVIADGIHIHPPVLDLIVKLKGPDRICLITDSMEAAGLKDGVFKLGGQEVFVKGAEARLADGTLAGSTLAMDQAVRNIINFTGVLLPEAIKMASYTPACAIGLGKITGSIEKGKSADLVILNKKLEVVQTIIKGEAVFTAEGTPNTSINSSETKTW